MSTLLLASGACTTGEGASTSPARADDPGSDVTLRLSDAQQRELDELKRRLAEVAGLDATGFAAKYAVPFAGSVGYDPLTAEGMSRIQLSTLSLDDAEKAVLGANAFVISERRRFPSFIYGYESIYAADLPVYISADSILYAVHQSYDAILKRVEIDVLTSALQRMLERMRTALAAGAASTLPLDARRDVDTFLAVAKSLLSGRAQAPVAGGDAVTVAAFLDGAMKASGAAKVSLFGTSRDVDFSQFKPRGHYTESEALQRYFRAMMWLGQIDFRIVETIDAGRQTFRRRQLEAAYVIRAAMDATAISDWKTIDDTVRAFVGESDNMTLPQLDGLLDDLGASGPAALASIPDATIAQAIVNGGYGTQRIAGHVMMQGRASGTLPLSSSFMLLGQRYVIDSHVFSNVVYDRVNPPGEKRMLPNGLDVAFGALRNDHAGILLGSEIARYRYAPDLASMRVIAEAHPTSFWEANLYNEWLGMLRTLSPTSTVSNPSAVGMPLVTGTESWGRRILSTQLASWAELRHDTILYAKQSYTTGAECEYPDVYVEPYPELFARLVAFAARGASIMSGLSGGATAYFERLAATAGILKTMAENQRAGMPHSAEHLAFVNQLTFQHGCGGDMSFDGWYAKLFFAPADAIQLNPTIADVHTQPPNDIAGVGPRVLHVGTGMPRTMIVTVESCTGPRAYVGLASSYFEHVADGYVRLDDKAWEAVIRQKTPPDAAWLGGIVVR